MREVSRAYVAVTVVAAALLACEAAAPSAVSPRGEIAPRSETPAPLGPVPPRDVLLAAAESGEETCRSVADRLRRETPGRIELRPAPPIAPWDREDAATSCISGDALARTIAALRWGTTCDACSVGTIGADGDRAAIHVGAAQGSGRFVAVSVLRRGAYGLMRGRCFSVALTGTRRLDDAREAAATRGESALADRIAAIAGAARPELRDVDGDGAVELVSSLPTETFDLPLGQVMQVPAAYRFESNALVLDTAATGRVAAGWIALYRELAATGTDDAVAKQYTIVADALESLYAGRPCAR